MNRQIIRRLGTPIVSAVVVLAAVAAAIADDSAGVKAQFADPPRGYATAPLWTWNDMLTEEQIVSAMEDLAGQKVKQVFVHPRPGLMTPYLGDDWFRLWKVALQTAERLDMNVWIYDENSYPSGFAGGLVPEAMPEARAKGLAIREAKQVGKVGDDVVAVFRLIKDDRGNRYENVTNQARAGDALPEGQYLVAATTLAPEAGWFGGKYYVDLLYPGVTQKFIEITLEAYRRHFGEEFGRRIPGWFTDEPHLAMAPGIHWADRLPEAFQKRWGYDLVESLPSLVRPVGDWRRVRHNYYQLLLEEFIRCWAQPCYEYCEKYHLEFTGHYWEHGWPDAGHGGDNMAMYAWHQRPAIDTLMNQYSEDVHAQFGNVRAVLELASVANQTGKKRTLCEAYGAGGWDLRFEDMKRIGDWLYVLGVNTLDEHIADITIRGARKRDHPQSFSYHEPWWEAYHVMAEYFTRLSLVMSSGEQVNRILLIEPTTTAWMYQGDAKLKEIGDGFQKLVTDLAKAQVEFDLGCEDIIGRQGSTDGAALIVGRRRYETVLLPPNTENLDTRTLDLLEAFLKAGGTVLSCSPPPTHIDGSPSDRGAALAGRDGFQRIDTQAASRELLNRSPKDFSVRQKEDSRGMLFHHRRQVDDGQFLLLVNTSIEARAGGEITAKAKSVQRWNLQTGQTRPYQFDVSGDTLTASFSLPPCGSLLLFLSNEPGKSGSRPDRERAAVPPVGPMEIRRTGPNVLTLDYVDVTAGGETKKDAYCFQAAEHVFKMNGLEGNPWHRAVQFRDELISKTFPPQSGFEATYKFTLAERVPESLAIVIERPDLYTITCNGKPVEATPGAWWLDKSFGRIEIADAAKVGANAVVIKASPMTMWHELEPAYLLGEFHLKPVESGFLVVPQKPLVLGSWKKQGLAMYGGGVGYVQKFNVPDASGRFTVAIPNWYGSVARVLVNGQPAGYVAYQPWSLDVSRQIVAGENTVEVVVIGTLKNTLGPHHFGDVVGAAWPHAFQQGPETGPPPGEKYQTLDYGLFEPFVLNRAK